MTDEERYIVQGRARDAAKKLRAEIATLKTFFEDYRERLKGAEYAVGAFLANPFEKAPTGKLWIDVVNADQQKLAESGFFDATFQYAENVRKLRELEEQIKEF